MSELTERCHRAIWNERAKLLAKREELLGSVEELDLKIKGLDEFLERYFGGKNNEPPLFTEKGST